MIPSFFFRRASSQLRYTTTEALDILSDSLFARAGRIQDFDKFVGSPCVWVLESGSSSILDNGNTNDANDYRNMLNDIEKLPKIFFNTFSDKENAERLALQGFDQCLNTKVISCPEVLFVDFPEICSHHYGHLNPLPAYGIGKIKTGGIITRKGEDVFLGSPDDAFIEGLKSLLLDENNADKAACPSNG